MQPTGRPFQRARLGQTGCFRRDRSPTCYVSGFTVRGRVRGAGSAVRDRQHAVGNPAGVVHAVRRPATWTASGRRNHPGGTTESRPGRRSPFSTTGTARCRRPAPGRPRGCRDGRLTRSRVGELATGRPAVTRPRPAAGTFRRLTMPTAEDARGQDSGRRSWPTRHRRVRAHHGRGRVDDRARREPRAAERDLLPHMTAPAPRRHCSPSRPRLISAAHRDRSWSGRTGSGRVARSSPTMTR